MRRGQISPAPGERMPLVEVRPAHTELRGAGSCLGDPQVSALDLVRRRDLGGLTSLLADVCPLDDEDREKGNNKVYPLPADHWINTPLAAADHKTLLHLALEAGAGHAEQLARLLVTAGARADLHNEDLGLSPVHVAAQNDSVAGLDVLLEQPRNKANINAVTRSGRTALHIAAERGHTPLLARLLGCPDLAAVDCEDLQGRQTPAWVAARHGRLEAVRLLLEHGASLRSAVEDRSLADYLAETFPSFRAQEVVVRVRPRQSTDTELLYSLAKLLDKAQLAEMRQESNSQNLVFFKTLVQSVGSGLKNTVDGGNLCQYVLDSYDSGGMTLLQKCCDYGLATFAAVLLEAGASAAATTEETRTAAVLLAAYSGHAATLAVLLGHKRGCGEAGKAARLDVQETHSRETVLHHVLKMPKRLEGGDTVARYRRCLDLLLGCSGPAEAELRKVINKRDSEGNSALHYATQSWSQATVTRLLEAGANIGLKNNWGETPIAKIRPETMESFLDNFCLRSKNDIHQEDFELEFNYSFIAPPVDNPYFDESDPEGQELVESAGYPETETLWHMAQSRGHRHLLKHPVITSFLWLKWQRIRQQFNRNLRLYLLFVATLTWYIFARFGGLSSRRLDPGLAAAPAPAYCSAALLSADLTADLSYTLFLLQAVFQLLNIARDWRRELRQSECGAACGVFLTSWLEYLIISVNLVLLIFQARAMVLCLSILLGLVLFRECLQMMVSLKRYIFDLENWLEMATLLITGTILYIPDEKFLLPCETKRYLAAFAIILSWATLITLVGRHPKLAKYNIYVTMFYKILETFVTFLVWYSLFLIAFSLGFYIMLHKDTKFPSNSDEASNGAEDEEEEYVFFNNPWLSLVKTSTMFVGEIEFSDIPIDLENGLWPLGYIFLLSFIFLIVVVLMNLLNGLAVSDTAVIRDKAEIVTYIIRVETVSCFEAVLLGDPFNFLANWPAIKLLQNIPSLAFCKALYRHSAVREVSHKVTGATGILLFYTWLKTKQLSIKPNKNNALCSCLAMEVMGKEVIESAKAVVVKKAQDAIDEGELKVSEKLTNLEEKQDSLQKQMSELSTKLDMVLTALNSR